MAKRDRLNGYKPSIPKTKIPFEVTNIPNNRDFEDDPYYISFEYYNNKECEVEELPKKSVSCILNDLKIICKSKEKNLRHSGIGCDSVYDSGEYSGIFKGLPDGVEVKEHKFHGTRRLYYFLLRHVFYVICTSNKHKESK